MIAAFNRHQTLLAAFNCLLSAIAVVATFVFFLAATAMVMKGFGFKGPPGLPFWVASVCLLFVMVFGIFEFRRGGGHHGYHESDLYPGFDLSTGSGYLANHRVQEVTAPAYILSQIFLAAPMQLMKGIDRIQSRIPETEDLERRLDSLLREVNATPKWHPLLTYANRAEEIGYLIRMEKIQFSPNKGTVRPL